MSTHIESTTFSRPLAASDTPEQGWSAQAQEVLDFGVDSRITYDSSDDDFLDIDVSFPLMSELANSYDDDEYEDAWSYARQRSMLVASYALHRWGATITGIDDMESHQKLTFRALLMSTSPQDIDRALSSMCLTTVNRFADTVRDMSCSDLRLALGTCDIQIEKARDIMCAAGITDCATLDEHCAEIRTQLARCGPSWWDEHPEGASDFARDIVRRFRDDPVEQERQRSLRESFINIAYRHEKG